MTTTAAPAVAREARIISAAWNALNAVTTESISPAGMLDALRTAASQMAGTVLADTFPGLTITAPTTGRSVLTWQGTHGAYLEITVYDGTCVDIGADLTPTAADALTGGAIPAEHADWRTDGGTQISDFTTAEHGVFYHQVEDGPEHTVIIRSDGAALVTLNALTVTEARDGLSALAAHLTEPTPT